MSRPPIPSARRTPAPKPADAIKRQDARILSITVSASIDMIHWSFPTGLGGLGSGKDLANVQRFIAEWNLVVERIVRARMPELYRGSEGAVGKPGPT